MRKIAAVCALGAGLVVVSASGATADHTGCPHDAGPTANAHATVPHRNHQAHMSIPYCPPEDAPRHGGQGAGGNHP